MLVSSIGYFVVNKTVVPDNIVTNQANKVNLNEGFGHFDEFNRKVDNKSNVLSKCLESVKSMFSMNKTDETSKYLSLIG